MTSNRLAWIMGFIVLFMLLGCSDGVGNAFEDGDADKDSASDGDDPSERVCDPGDVKECPCPGGSPKGVQVCADDGSRWEACNGCQPQLADGDKPEGEIPDGEESDGDPIDGDLLDGDEADGDESDGDLPDGDETDGDESDGDLPDGDETDGDQSDGDLPDGDEADGDESDGDLPDGDLPDGDETDGEEEQVPFNCNYPLIDDVHVGTRFAALSSSSGDWEDIANARGAADGAAAHTPNLDAGDVLYAGAWGFCHETGIEEILKVELSVYGRTQYDSGTYDVLVKLSGGGGQSVNWHHTGWAWSTVDLTSDRGHWSWDDVENIIAAISLHSHPNGARDSDVWIDAFRLTVTTGNCGEDCGTDGDVPEYSCEAIGSNAYGDGFFTLAAFKGKLYSGLFGYGLESYSMLHSYPEWQITSPGLTGIGESICAMQEFNGQLYANTENSGDIFRSSDGSNWSRVYDGHSGSIGCGLSVFDNQLYAINYRNSEENHGQILRSSNGASWSSVYDSGSDSMYLREIIAYGNKIYAFAILTDSNSGRMFSSSNGTSWTIQEVPNRYFRGHVWSGYLWLGSVKDAGSSGEVAVWRFDGSTFQKALQGDRMYFSNIKDLDGQLFAATSNGWKNESGPSSLWVSPDGMSQWRKICEFNRTAVWSMAVLDSTLYLGTWQYGVGGHVYRVIQADTGCNPQQGSLGQGQSYTVGVDAHSGDEGTTQPKSDANDGQNGDNPRFRRHNVARAHNDYWYTSAYQGEGEPDPNGEQWVDFTPDFSTLGVGCYHILTEYRGTSNRATYPVPYQVRNSEGLVAQIEQIQHPADGAYVDVDMGNHYLCEDSFARVVDTGSDSISFHPMSFTYLGESCP